MGFYTPEIIDELEQDLLTRQKKLISEMRGRAITEAEVHDTRRAEDSRYIVARRITVAVDDYSTILRSIKSTFKK